MNKLKKQQPVQPSKKNKSNQQEGVIGAFASTTTTEDCIMWGVQGAADYNYCYLQQLVVVVERVALALGATS